MKKKIFITLLLIILNISCIGKPNIQQMPEPSLSITYTTQPTSTPTIEPTVEPTPKITLKPTIILTSVPTSTPKPTEIPTTTYKNKYYRLKIYDENNNKVKTLKFEETVQFIDSNKNTARILYNEKICHCDASALVPINEVLYGYLDLTKYGIDSCLVDVRIFIPDVEVEQLLGTTNNCTGTILYENPVPVLRIETVKKLQNAAKVFAGSGHRIKIYDVYRPKSAQFAMYDVVQNSAYVSNPYRKSSNHNRAKAIDMTLIDMNGNELSFPSPMHTFERIVYRDQADKWTAEQRNNVNYMTYIMEECGFTIIPSEWWHFADSASDFPVLSYNKNGKEYYIEMNAKDIPRYTYDELMKILLEKYSEYFN